MAQFALLLGVTNGKRTIIDQGDPRDMRVKFKTATDGAGFDQWEVIESSVGRSRKKVWNEKIKPQTIAEAIDVEPTDESGADEPKRRGRPPKQ